MSTCMHALSLLELHPSMLDASFLRAWSVTFAAMLPDCLPQGGDVIPLFGLNSTSACSAVHHDSRPGPAGSGAECAGPIPVPAVGCQHTRAHARTPTDRLRRFLPLPFPDMRAHVLSQGYASVIYALAKLRVGPTLIGDEFFADWGRCSITQLAHFDTVGLVNVGWALGKLQESQPHAGLVLDETFVHAWLDAIQARLSRLAPHQLSSILFALVKLGVCPSSFLRRWEAVSAPRFDAFSSRDLATTIWALGRMGDGVQQRRAFFFRAWAAAVSGGRLGAARCGVASHGRAKAESRLHEFNAHELVIRCCGSKPRAVTDSWLGARSIEALARLGVGPGLLGQDFFRSWAQACMSLMDKFDPRNLLNAIWGLGRLQVGPVVLGWPFFVKWANLRLKRAHATHNAADWVCSMRHYPSLDAQLQKTMRFAMQRLELRPEYLGVEFPWA